MKSPFEIPFTRLKYIRTVINPSVAEAYGISTPEGLLKTADLIVGEPDNTKPENETSMANPSKKAM